MKNFIPAIVAVVLIVGGIWYFGTQPSTPASIPAENKTAQNQAANSNDASAGAGSAAKVSTDGVGGVEVEGLDANAGDMEIPEEKPAPQLYKTAEDALKAARAGAKEYDDLILEQFTNLGEDCTWCDSFYKSVKDLVLAPDTSKEERGYLAELLAISGRLSNIQTLVDAMKSSTDQATIDTFAEALELAYAKDKDDIVNYLGTQLTANNDRLKEASVAALTNQGSQLAADILYKHTVESGDPSGYYSLGIGLGEFVPDEKTLPYLQELAAKRDQYSHLAVKAMLNGGLPGLKVVFDVLKNSSDGEFDKKMLDGAVDHVSFEDGVEEYVKQEIAGATKPTIKEFGEQILKELAGADEAAGDELAVPTPPMSVLDQ